VVQQTPLHPRPLDDVQPEDGTAGLYQTQEMERAPERADLARGRDDRDEVTIEGGRSNHVAVFPGALEIPRPSERGNRGKTAGRGHENNAVRQRRHDRNRLP
jgi:hypothetical protein